MRILSISVIALLSVLQDCAAERSLSTPSVFAVREHKHPASTAIFGIPRGGSDVPRGGKVATKKARMPTSPTPTKFVSDMLKAGTDVATSPMPKLSKFLSDIFSPDRIGWTISLGINLIYLVAYFTRQADNTTCDFTNAGFCVTNLVVQEPNVQSCPPASNSHTWAFIVDCIMFAVALKVPYSPTTSNFTKFGLIGLILFHGGLHGFLGLVRECSVELIPGLQAIFGVFAGLTGYFVVNSVASNFNQLLQVALGVATGVLCLILAGPGGTNGISGIFFITQILASGLCTFLPIENGRRLGLSFIVPCLISLIELVYCCDPNGGGASLFNKIGGHAWYDVFLHLSFLIALIDGPTSKKIED